MVTLLGFKMAQQPADAEHPYGHARYEYLSGLVVAALILIIGFDLAKSSFQKILHPEAVEFSAATFIVLVLSIAVKLWIGGILPLSGESDSLHYPAGHLCGQPQ